MKKSIAILCTLLMLFSFKTIAHAEENSIQVLSDSKEYSIGDKVKVVVNVVGAKDLYSADLTINYDPEYLELVASKFNLLQELGNSAEKGTSRHLLSILGQEKGINGDVDIAEFEFKAIKNGTAKINLPSTIFVNSKEEKKENIKANPLDISIKEKINIINVEGVKLNTEKYRLKVGECYKLVHTILPENASNKNVTWTSNNPSLVEVKDGSIKGLKEGNALITIITEDGNKTAQCIVEVYKATDNGNNGGENPGNEHGEGNEDNKPGQDDNSGVDELPQTGGNSYLPIIGLGMVVLGAIIKKRN